MGRDFRQLERTRDRAAVVVVLHRCLQRGQHGLAPRDGVEGRLLEGRHLSDTDIRSKGEVGCGEGGRCLYALVMVVVHDYFLKYTK